MDPHSFIAAATTLPAPDIGTPIGRGLLYAVCLGLLIPAAGFFPLWCLAAMRGRRRGLSVLAAASGVVAITCGLLLQPTLPGALPVVGLYFVVAMAVMLVLARFRAGRTRPTPQRRAN